MKNKTEEQIQDQVLDLGKHTLSADQVEQRDTQILSIAKAFTEAIAVDAYQARDQLVSEMFARLQLAKELSWQEHAQLCIGLNDIRTRDGLLRMLHDAPELRSQFQSHLIREVTRAQQDFAAPLATVYAGIAWLEGERQLTRLAVDHALKIDSSYSLAQLLDIALRHDVPASVWSSSLAAVSFDACLKGAA